MPIQLYYILQCALVFCLYTLITVVLPLFVLGKKLMGLRAVTKLMFCFVTGNAFINTLVTLMQLLRICCGFTLALSTIAVSALLYVKFNGKPAFRLTKKGIKKFNSVMAGKMGVKTFIRRAFSRFRYRFYVMMRRIYTATKGRKADILLTAAIMTAVTRRYGQRFFSDIGYAASDMIVHNYWLNSLGERRLYAGGVYPRGLHCVLHYFHDIFGFDNYILLGVFWLVQFVYLCLTITAFLKLCCKNKYLPYLAVLIHTFASAELLNIGMYGRFFAALPQEFGMLFIMPTLYFIFDFLQHAQPKDNEPPKRQLLRLTGFGLSFSMSVSAHFYNTIIIGLFCIGGVIAYSYRIFRIKNLIKITVSGTGGLVLAVLPMVIAVLSGNRLEGSLLWGIEVIAGKKASSPPPAPAANETAVSSTAASVPPLSERLLGKFESICGYMTDNINVMAHGGKLTAAVILMILPAALLTGLLLIIFRQKDRGSRLITTGLGMTLITLMATASVSGFPSLIDESRSSIYFYLLMPVLAVMLADAILLLPARLLSRIKIFDTAAALSSIAAAVYLTAFIPGSIFTGTAYQSTEALLCLTNIIRGSDDRSWTVCSANDELRLADKHGFHTELCEMLWNMEQKGSYANVRIPTPYVYFFVEKTPLQYGELYESVPGEPISAEDAQNPLPPTNGIVQYQRSNRRIVMARAYFWAMEFMKKYPNEMKVYYESDKFICFKLEQNPYSLYNLAIDYGYNTSRR